MHALIRQYLQRCTSPITYSWQQAHTMPLQGRRAAVLQELPAGRLLTPRSVCHQREAQDIQTQPVPAQKGQVAPVPPKLSFPARFCADGGVPAIPHGVGDPEHHSQPAPAREPVAQPEERTHADHHRIHGPHQSAPDTGARTRFAACPEFSLRLCIAVLQPAHLMPLPSCSMPPAHAHKLC